MIYLDNAATSWPKPPEVLQAMTNTLEQAGGNPGRSGHSLSISAARVMFDAREAVAGFFGSGDPLRVIFTMNVTHALNLALRGLLRPGDRVVTTSMEHNSVMRPLRFLEGKGVTVEVVPCHQTGELDLPAMERALAEPARLVVMNHASNVTGTILPVADVSVLAHRAGALLLVDAAQTAGVLPIDINKDGIDLLGFTGHKGLLGPPGTGGLVLGDNVDIAQIEPLILGGTGSQSEQEIQPEHLPDKYESGTQNITGIAGLLAGIRYLEKTGISEIRAREIELAALLRDGLREIPGIRLYGCDDASAATAIVSLTIEGMTVSEAGFSLDEDYGILSRVGLHCAPAAHRTIGSYPSGTVRLAPGYTTSRDDIIKVTKALKEIASA